MNIVLDGFSRSVTTGRGVRKCCLLYHILSEGRNFDVSYYFGYLFAFGMTSYMLDNLKKPDRCGFMA